MSESKENKQHKYKTKTRRIIQIMDEETNRNENINFMMNKVLINLDLPEKFKPQIQQAQSRIRQFYFFGDKMGGVDMGDEGRMARMTNEKKI